MAEREMTAKELAEFKQRKNMLACRKVFLEEGLKGGLMFGSVGLLFSFVGPRFMSATARRYFPLNLRAFVSSAAFIAGFWIYGEPASNACARDPYKKEEVKVFDNQL